MDLRKASNENKLIICRKYFYGGIALLPFLWAINAIWFFKTAFREPEFREQKQIRSYVIKSMIGSILWLIVLAAWITIFQVYRTSWGAVADRMSFVIPLNFV